MFTSSYHPQPSQRAHNAGSPSAAQIQAAIATLRALAPSKPAAVKPTSGYRASDPAPRAYQEATWQRIERCTVYLTDTRLCPVPLPLRAQKGLAALSSGHPAKRFVADGFVGRNGKPVGCLVVPNFENGAPMVIWADGAPTASFKIKG